MPYYYGNFGGGGNRGFLSNTPPITRNLIILNLIIFVATWINRNVMISEFALFYPTSIFFHWWQCLTHMFLHGSFWHILFNMYTLWLFGKVVEDIIGSKKFVLFYFICGFGAAALHIGVEYFQIQSYMESAAMGNSVAVQNIAIIKNTPTVGASGAIYGVLIAFALLFPSARMTLLFPPVTLTAKWMVIIFAGMELLFGFTGTATGIAHFAHLGGMLIGYLMIILWRKRGKLFDKNHFF